jgi:hypothetical protein
MFYYFAEVQNKEHHCKHEKKQGLQSNNPVSPSD